ncbi:MULTISPECIES: phage portal protein [Clostridium]|uniref:phage portal protein n=1 Tax=Clostridium TaxID=1485 RepID=UPI0008251710|nr:MULTISPECIES: phage portal protein [Clostridium]PJI07654.1 phage portal protein [Clostridium sp. CT7]
MQTLEDYIADRYGGDSNWFEQEVEQGNHLTRISNVVNNIEYLLGRHKISQREDTKWKGQEYITKKLILNQAKTILNFHSTYLLGKPLSLTGSENKVKEYQNIYRRGNYNNIDFKILDNVIKYADSYEYVYIDNNKNIVSKIIHSEDGYPIYSEDTGEYIGFIEYYTMDSNKVSYYNVYYTDKVEQWNNEGGELQLIDTKSNISGLPIHYSNDEGEYDNFGRSLLEDLKPIFDEFEDIFSKMSDSIYTLSLNPMPVSIGQRIEGTIPSDACGYMINLDAGSFDYKNATIDSATVKLYLDKLQQQLNIIAHMPSVATGNSNVSNVSEVSLKLLYSLSDVMAMLNEKWMRRGLQQRFEYFDKLLGLLGVTFSDNEYIDVEFNYSRPVNGQDLLNEIQTQFNMGAISKQSIIEKSPLTTDVSTELERLKKENNTDGSTGNNSGNNSNNGVENKELNTDGIKDNEVENSNK